MTKRDYKIAAVIEIGNDAVEMKIAQSSENQSIETLEELKQPINTLSDDAITENISFDTAGEIADILRKYYTLADEYKIPREYITAFASAGIKSARNKDYIADQITVKTSRELIILENSKEISLIFAEMMRKKQILKDESSSYLMMYLAADNTGLAVVCDNEIIYYQNLKIEYIKLSKITEDISSILMSDFLKVTDEYLSYITSTIKNDLSAMKIDKIFACGEHIDIINQLCDEKSDVLQKQSIISLLDSTASVPLANIGEQYKNTYKKSKKILVSVALCNKIIDYTNCDEMRNLNISLKDSMLYGLLFKKQQRDDIKDFDRNMISSARHIAGKYDYDIKHSMCVEKFALTVFDNLKKVHGFSRRERLYLQTAAILHDIGRYVNSRNYDIATANIIMSSPIISLNEEQKKIIANIARYHGKNRPSNEHELYASLTAVQKITVSKLSAILMIADALDYSHMQKIDDITLNLHEKRLDIIATVNSETTLEEWTLFSAGSFFEQVFGLKCGFIKKGLL